MTTPWIAARDIAPGDVVVLAPGDTRRVVAVETLDSGQLVHLDFGDGRLSLLDSWKPVVRLHPVLPSPVPPTVPPVPPSTVPPTSPQTGAQQ